MASPSMVRKHGRLAFGVPTPPQPPRPGIPEVRLAPPVPKTTASATPARAAPTLPSISLTPLKPTHLYAALPLPAAYPDMIRLIDLEPCPKDQKGSPIVDSPLACRLRTIRLGEFPCFTALSYVWGNTAVPADTIACSTTRALSAHVHPPLLLAPSSPWSYWPATEEVHCKLEITANCHAALRQIRNRFGPVTIWVDAICINQEDDAEKVKQIPLMKDIYTWSAAVYIWLGHGTSESDLAMECLHRNGIVMTRLPLSWLAAVGETNKERERLAFWAECLLDTLRRLSLLFSLNPNREVMAKALNDLLDRDWMHRVWTYQEVILSAHPVILCGNRVLDWSRLVNLMCCYNAKKQRGRWWRVNPKQLIVRNTRLVDLKLDTDGSWSPSYLNSWRRLIDVWLQFPRQTRWNGVLVRRPPSSLSWPSWREVIGRGRGGGGFGGAYRGAYGVEIEAGTSVPSSSFAQSISLLDPHRCITRHFRIFLLAIRISKIFVLLAIWSLNILTAFSNRPDLIDLDSAVATIVVVLVCIFLSILFWVAASLVWFAMIGLPYSRFVPDGRDGSNSNTASPVQRGAAELLPDTMSTMSKMEALDGIRDALRQRQSGRPHDRAIGLHGVIASLTASEPPRPNYGEPYGETFRELLQRLVAWHPAAIALIMDSGVGDKGASERAGEGCATGKSGPPPGAPSWVPPWGGGGHSGPSSWLVARYSIATSTCSITTVRPHGGGVAGLACIPPPSIHGNVLKLRADRCGRISLLVRLATDRGHKNDPDGLRRCRIKRMLYFLRKFALDGKYSRGTTEVAVLSEYDVSPPSRAFIVAEGVAPKFWGLANEAWNEGTERPERPTDLPRYQEEYVVFRRIFDLLDPKQWTKREIATAFGDSTAAAGGGVAATPSSSSTTTKTTTTTATATTKSGKGKGKAVEVEAALAAGDGRTAACPICQDEEIGRVYDMIGGVVKDSHALLAELARKIVLQDRGLFILDSGQIGSGPSGTEAGDGIFLLQGVPVPMALRAATRTTRRERRRGQREEEGQGGDREGERGERNWEDETYISVGAVLVHGLMQGETKGPSGWVVSDEKSITIE